MTSRGHPPDKDGGGRGPAPPRGHPAANVERPPNHTDTADPSVAAARPRRRDAALRLPPLWPCGCIRDPDHDRHRCHHNPSQRQIDGYRDAVLHLRALDLTPAPLIPEMRALWRRGEHRLVTEIAEQWELAR